MSQVTLPYPNPQSATQYAEDLDIFIGAPILTKPATAVTTAWVESESPSFPGFNGLGTELDLPGATRNSENPAVYNYPTLISGLTAAKDEIEGGGPQTSADAAQFAKDIQSGKATESQLVTDIYNSHWAGTSIPDTYDANAIASKLGIASPSGTVKATHHSGLDSILTLGGHLPGGGVIDDAVGAPESLAKGALSSVAGTVGNYILKGVLTVIGGGLILYGATLLTGRSGARSSAPAATLGGGAAGAGASEELPAFGPEDLIGAAAA